MLSTTSAPVSSINMRFLNLLAGCLAVKSVEVLAATCSAGSQTINNRVCTTSCGVDRAGGDYANKYTGSFQACVNACAADTKCVTAQYHEDNGYCYFKNAANKLSNVKGTDTVDCAAPVTTTVCF